MGFFDDVEEGFSDFGKGVGNVANTLHDDIKGITNGIGGLANNAVNSVNNFLQGPMLLIALGVGVVVVMNVLKK